MPLKSLFFTLGLMLLSTELLAADQSKQCQQLYDQAEYARALMACQQDANNGHAPSQTLLGEMYDQGLGVEKNPEMVERWWTVAAQQLDLSALNQLALKYYYGGGVFGPEAGWNQDYAKARELWQQSAFQGQATSQFMLGEMHLRGQGVETDYAEAYAWFNISLEGGYKLATDSLIELSKLISKAQKKAGLDRVSEIKKSLAENKH